jgi:DNA-binding response OmpR family regulator
VILCVDDEVPALEIRCLILSIAGYEVLTAADGVDALELFRCIPVDLVIADYWLPGLDARIADSCWCHRRPLVTRETAFFKVRPAPVGCT